jgi:hypothetical protein
MAAQRGWIKVWLLSFVVIGTAAVVVGVLSLEKIASGEQAALGGSCDDVLRPVPAALLASTPTGASPEVTDGKLTERRDFERSREPATIRTEMHLGAGVEPGVRNINVRVGPFERSDGVQLDAQQVSAYALIASKAWRDVIEVVLCVDPVVPGDVPGKSVRATAGSYSGTVFIDDRRVIGGAVTYTINLKYEHRGLVLLCIAGAGLIGAVTGSLLASGLEWSLDKENLLRALATSVSCVAALYTVYQAQYATDPSWLGNDAMFTSLAATCVGVAYAATNFSGSVTISRGTRRGRPPERGPSHARVRSQRQPVTWWGRSRPLGGATRVRARPVEGLG